MLSFCLTGVILDNAGCPSTGADNAMSLAMTRECEAGWNLAFLIAAGMTLAGGIFAAGGILAAITFKLDRRLGRL